MNSVDPSDIALLLGSGRFDPDWYAERYPDVGPTGMSPAEHYLWLGKRLGRRGKPARLDDAVIDVDGALRAIPDLAATGGDPVREAGDRRMDAPGLQKPLCILVHLYYPEMWGEISHYIENIDMDCDIYVNVVESTWNLTVVSQIRSAFPHARIKISPNEGRDIGGFFSLLADVNFHRYLAFALLHSKKSPHVSRDYVASWKKHLLEAILGTPEIARENVAAFLEDDEIGIIGSARSRHVGIDGNGDGMEALFTLYRISEENRDCEYVSGTMMMVRSDVMEAVYNPLKNQAFANGDDKGLDHHMDGQIEHSVERIFGNVMKQLGYRFLWR